MKVEEFIFQSCGKIHIVGGGEMTQSLKVPAAQAWGGGGGLSSGPQHP